MELKNAEETNKLLICQKVMAERVPKTSFCHLLFVYNCTKIGKEFAKKVDIQSRKIEKGKAAERYQGR